MAETVVLKVGMSCGGCVGAVNRVLTKMEGVETFDIDLEKQKVTVKGNVKPEAVLQTVSKTGKKTSFWEEVSEAKEATPAAPAPEAVSEAKEATPAAPAPEAVSEAKEATPAAPAPAPEAATTITA